MSEPLKANWNYPTTVWAGPGRIAELPAACAALGIRRPLLVTDEGLRDAPMVRAARGAGARHADCFADVRGNPVAANIEEGLVAYRAGGHDGVIAFGGGSALDAGKVIAFMSGQTRPLWDFEDVGDWWTRADRRGIAPVVAVPTTAGTGSEVGRAGVVINEETHQKKIIFHPQMMPGVVISDPELTVGLPPTITAATGMDAFVHCFEAFCAPGFHPLADGIALEGMRLIQTYLPRACAQRPGHRGALAHAGGGQHGRDRVPEGPGRRARHCPPGRRLLQHPPRADQRGDPAVRHRPQPPRDRVAARRSWRACSTSRASRSRRCSTGCWGSASSLEIPHTLAEIGVPLSNPDIIGHEASLDPSAGGNPLPTDAATYARIFRSAVKGDLRLGG